MTEIGFISTMEGCAWGGSEELWYAAAAFLSQNGVSVACNVKSWPIRAQALARLEHLGCKIHYRYRHSLHDRIARRLHRDPDHPNRWLTRVAPRAVVISQGSNVDGGRWADACATLNIPYVMVAQAASEHWWPDDDSAIAMRNAYLNATQSAFVCRANKSLTERQLGMTFTNAQIVCNPFNVSYDAAPQWRSGEGQMLRLACVGRLDPHAKGQDLIVEVLARSKWRDRAVVVSFYGRGPCENSLRRLCDMRGIKNIRFCGHTDNIEQVWADHHALILPSRYEGLPLSVVEAMLCARPCIVTNVGGNAELISDGVDGFVAAVPTYDLVDDALERAWQSRHLLQHMGALAAARVRKLIPSNPGRVFAGRLVKLFGLTESNGVRSHGIQSALSGSGEIEMAETVPNA